MEVIFKLLVKSGNAAVTDAPRDEVSRILHKVAQDVYGGKQNGIIMDANGNRVGFYSLGSRR